MLALALAVGIALLIPAFTRGSYVRLVMAPWRWVGLLLVGFLIQVGLEYVDIPESRWDDVGFGLLVASYVLVLAFCARNLLFQGMSIVLIGVAMNALVITVNQGMPVEIPPDWEESALVDATIKHHPRDADDDLVFLSDIIVLREPFDTVLSFGDLIMAVGLCDVFFHLSRRPRRRRTITPQPAAMPSAGTQLDPAFALDLAAPGSPHGVRDDDRRDSTDYAPARR